MSKISQQLYEEALRDLDITAQGFRDAACGVPEDKISCGTAYTFGRSLFRGKVVPQVAVTPSVPDRAQETTAFLAGLYGDEDVLSVGGEAIIAAFRRGVARRFAAGIGMRVVS